MTATVFTRRLPLPAIDLHSPLPLPDAKSRQRRETTGLGETPRTSQKTAASGGKPAGWEGLVRAWRQEHATHEPLIGRAMLAEVPLAGLSFPAVRMASLALSCQYDPIAYRWNGCLGQRRGVHTGPVTPAATKALKAADGSHHFGVMFFKLLTLVTEPEPRAACVPCHYRKARSTLSLARGSPSC